MHLKNEKIAASKYSYMEKMQLDRVKHKKTTHIYLLFV